jgi:hypothetical protein
MYDFPKGFMNRRHHLALFALRHLTFDTAGMLCVTRNKTRREKKNGFTQLPITYQGEKVVPEFVKQKLTGHRREG